MKFFEEIFKKNLVTLISQRKLSQGDVAKALDISDQALSAWVTGKTTPAKKNLDKLASFFNVPTDVLASVDLEKSNLVQEPLRDYGTDRIVLHLKKMNLRLEEIITENLHTIARITEKA